MSERQKRKKAKELEKASMSPKEPPTKLQKAVTHWLRKNVPTKKTKFLHAHIVEYFVASKAIGKILLKTKRAENLYYLGKDLVSFWLTKYSFIFYRCVVE